MNIPLLFFLFSSIFSLLSQVFCADDLAAKQLKRILVIGGSGVGKSSVINLLANKKLAKTSDGAMGCTFDFDIYQVTYNGEEREDFLAKNENLKPAGSTCQAKVSSCETQGNQTYELVDTIGLNEGSKGTVTAKVALKKLIKFVKDNKSGFNFIVFVMKKGRIDDSFEKNHFLFYKILLQEKIPAMLFVGHCEPDEPMSAWCDHPENKNFLYDYHFVKVICGTTMDRGRFAEQVEPLRAETRKNLWKTIGDHMLDEPIRVKADLGMFKHAWNALCDYFGWTIKFVTDQFKAFLEFLKLQGVDDETLEDLNLELH